MAATPNENPVGIQVPVKTPEETLKQEILDAKITGITEEADITDELLEKYRRWRETNEKLDRLSSGSSLTLTQFEEMLEKQRDTTNSNPKEAAQ